MTRDQQAAARASLTHTAWLHLMYYQLVAGVTVTAVGTDGVDAGASAMTARLPVTLVLIYTHTHTQ